MVQTARAAVMSAPNEDLQLSAYPLPDVDRGCILVKIRCCTICGSDLHTWQGRRKSPLPIILGHEIVGTIAALGEGVNRDSADRHLKTGDRITWTIMDNCGKCYYCRQAGLMMKCRHLKKYGHDSCAAPPHFVGGFADYCYLSPGTCVFKVPEVLSDLEIAPANCTLATAVAAWEAVDVKPFENVLIQGAGALGFYAAALAQHYGCRRVMVTDILDHRLDLIRQFGATDTLNTRDMNPAEVVEWTQSLTSGRGADCAMEAAGIPGLIPVGLKCLRIGGRYVGVGTVFTGADFSYDAGDLVFRMLTLKGIHNYDAWHLRRGIDFLSMNRDRFPFHKMISHTVGLDDINRGLALAATGQAIRVAVLP